MYRDFFEILLPALCFKEKEESASTLSTFIKNKRGTTLKKLMRKEELENKEERHSEMTLKTYEEKKNAHSSGDRRMTLKAFKHPKLPRN